MFTSFEIFSQEEKPPFPIHESKRISPEDLKEKQEGSYITGLPSITTDPVTGVWIGVSGFYFENGNKTDPLFSFAPYKYKITTDVYQSSVGAKYYSAGIDLPYIFNSPFRLNIYGAYSRNLRELYFGIGEDTLRGLQYRDRDDPGQPLITDANFEKRADALDYRRPGRSSSEPAVVTDKRYNELDSAYSMFTATLDKTFWGRFRFAGGIDFMRIVIHDYYRTTQKAKDNYFGNTNISAINIDIPTFQSKTKLTEDQESKKITGYGGGYVNYLRAGLAYDTRDFEPNPKNGIVVEINLMKSSKAWGSSFEFQRFFTQGKFYYQLFPKLFKEMVLGGRAALTYVYGTVPFSEYRSLWSIDKSIFGLGGGQTLLGYKQNRFVGPVMGFGNLDLRIRFASANIGSERFTFSIVPGFGLGRVWDRTKNINLQEYKYSYSLGLRIIWNLSTVISIDYGKSREDQQLFMNFDHTF